MKRRQFLLVPIGLACACSDDDAATEWHFATDPIGEGPVVFVRQASSTGSELVLSVVARGVVALHGLGFCLSYSPNALRFTALESSGVWPESRVELAKEASPGLLLVGLGARGSFEGLGDAEIELARLRLRIERATRGRIDFVASRSQAFDAAGFRVHGTRWVGGALR